MWNRLFDSQAYNQIIYKHRKFPIYITKEFDFFRCVPFDENMYGVPAYNLFINNLRKSDGRYSKLFGDSKVSYWCNSPDVARAEVRKHKDAKDTLMFWAYDDFSSFVPCREDSDFLHILDARSTDIANLIEKIDKNEQVSEKERNFFKELMKEEIDAIAYQSKAVDKGENFIFNERGFAKLALKWIRLRFSKLNGGSSNRIWIVCNGDYNPYVEAYAEFFAPKCCIKKDKKFLETEEFKKIKSTHDNNLRKKVDHSC